MDKCCNQGQTTGIKNTQVFERAEKGPLIGWIVCGGIWNYRGDKLSSGDAWTAGYWGCLVASSDPIVATMIRIQFIELTMIITRWVLD